jgi:two-component system, response regulator
VTETALDVLLVEDNLDDVRFITTILQQIHPAIVIECVDDVDGALEYIFNTGRYAHRPAYSTPHLILLDLTLPKKPGTELLRVTKAYARTQVIPVVILTAAPDEQQVVDSYQLGANGYVQKPIDPTQFRQVVENISAYWLSTNKTSSDEKSTL